MITIFRKEMKKWHSVLWVVFASMAVSGLSLVFWRSQGGDDAEIASVNGSNITGRDFRNSIQQLQRQFSMISSMYGISLDMLIKTFLGGQDLQSMALENSIKDSLVRDVEKTFQIQIGSDFFNEELVKNLPQGMADAQGRVNMEMYQNYLERISMTPAEFEKVKEFEFKKDAVQKIVGAAGYEPNFVVRYQAAQDNAVKSFKIVKFEQEGFKKNVEASDKDLKQFYNENKERYRVAEKKQVRIVRLAQKDYENLVTIDDAAIQSFYEKNKGNRYRVAPKIRVRHIALSGHDDKTRKKAEDLLSQVRKDISKFALLAKEHSQANSSTQGGLTELFGRGTFDPEFEKEAFRLNKKGDIAPLVKTSKGYEIIMLDERQAAQEKKLAEVRDEIVAALKTRKAANQLKSELEGVLHQSKTDEKAFSRFVEGKGAKKDIDLWVAADEKPKKDSLESKLGEKLFGKANRNIGYFIYNDDEYVLYQVVKTEKSYISPFEEVKKDVLGDFLKKKSNDDLKLFVKAAKKDVLDKNRDLDSYKSEGFSVFKVEGARKTDSVPSLKDYPNLLSRAFMLDDESQVLEYRYKDLILLIQLVNIELDKNGEGVIDAKKRKGYNSSSEASVMNGFIASLQRNAKITVNETLMNAYKSL